MTNQLYVGNLSFDTTEDTLRTTFEQEGRTVVKVSLVSGRQPGKSRGFAFVQMKDDEQANAAMAAHNGTEIDGRTVKVDQGKPRPEFQAGNNRGGGSFGGNNRRGGGRGRR